MLAEMFKPCGVGCDDVWRSEAVADAMTDCMRKERLLVQQEATAAVNFFLLSLGEAAGNVRRHVTAPLVPDTPPAPGSLTTRCQAQQLSIVLPHVCLIHWTSVACQLHGS